MCVLAYFSPLSLDLPPPQSDSVMHPAGAMKTEPWSEEEDKIVEEHAGLGASLVTPSSSKLPPPRPRLPHARPPPSPNGASHPISPELI